MATYNGIPVYKVKFKEGDEKGLDFISLVDTPAIMTNWVAMSNEVKIHLSEDKQILTGPILIPDQYIYRYDEKMGDYYIVFSKDEIQMLVRDFQAKQKTDNLNYQHKDNSKIESAVIQEIWLSGTPDKSNALGYNLPEGTAFISAYIGDKEFWMNEVKSGKVKGFSIEGFLDIQLNKQKMSQTKLIQANAADGTLVKSDSETWTVGSEVYSEKDEAKIKVEDGEYNIGNGTVLKVKDSKIEEIVEVEAEEIAELRAALKPITDKYEAEIADLKTKMAALETKIENAPAKQEFKKEEKKTAKTPLQIVTQMQEMLREKNKTNKN
jgi:hypothetical protein